MSTDQDARDASTPDAMAIDHDQDTLSTAADEVNHSLPPDGLPPPAPVAKADTQPRIYHFVSDRASRFTGEGTGHIVTPLCTLQDDQWHFRLEQNTAPTAHSQKYLHAIQTDPGFHKTMDHSLGGWKDVASALKSSYDTDKLQSSIDEAVNRSAALSHQYGNALFPFSDTGVYNFNPGLPLVEAEAVTTTPCKRMSIDTTLQPHPERQHAIIVYMPDDDMGSLLTLPVESNPQFTVQCRSAISVAGDGFEPEWRLDLVAQNPTGVHARYMDSLHAKLAGAVSDCINEMAEADDFYEWPVLEGGPASLLDVVKDKEMEAQEYLEKAIMQTLEDIRTGVITVEPKRLRAISSERTIKAFDHANNVIFEANPEIQVDSNGEWWNNPQAGGSDDVLAEYKTTADALFANDPSHFLQGRDTFVQASKALSGTDPEAVGTALAAWSAAQEAQYRAVLARMPSVARVAVSGRQRGQEMTELFPIPDTNGVDHDPSHLFTNIHGPSPSTTSTETGGTTATAPLFSIGEKYTHRITTFRHLLLDEVNPSTGEPTWRSGLYDLAMATTVEVTPDGLRPHFELIARETPNNLDTSLSTDKTRGKLTSKRTRRARPRMAPDKDPWVRGLLRTVESALSTRIGEKTGTLRGGVAYEDIQAPAGQSVWLTLQSELARLSGVTQEAAKEVVEDLAQHRLKVRPDRRGVSRSTTSGPCHRSALAT